MMLNSQIIVVFSNPSTDQGLFIPRFCVVYPYSLLSPTQNDDLLYHNGPVKNVPYNLLFLTYQQFPRKLAAVEIHFYLYNTRIVNVY